MTTQILRENVLTDNTLLISDEGKFFKGGYKAILQEFSYKNDWSDKKQIKRFRKLGSLKKYLTKNYSETEIENINIQN